MADSRTSNKQILDAIEKLTNVLTQNMVQPKAENIPTLSEPVETSAKADETVTVSRGPKYLQAMEKKFLTYSAKIGEPVVAYVYQSSKGENLLWSVPASKWASSPKIRNLVGPYKVIGEASQ